MEEIRIHQLHAIAALTELKKICEKYKITFFLLAGSALGAVRHQGMIPWDDDIDIGLLYDDWYKLRKILPRELSMDFQYIDNDVNPMFPRLFGKILYNGRSCVDLFLIAKWTSNRVSGEIHWQIRRCAVQFYKYYLCYTAPPKKVDLLKRIKGDFFESIRNLLYQIIKNTFEREDYIRLARWNEQFYENRYTDYYINLYSIYSMRKEMIKAEWIRNLVPMKFENDVYMVIGCTDEYLTHLYGNYMTPPAPKKRIQNHGEKFEVN